MAPGISLTPESPKERQLTLGRGNADAGGELRKAGPAYCPLTAWHIVIGVVVEWMFCQERTIELYVSMLLCLMFAVLVRMCERCAVSKMD